MRLVSVSSEQLKLLAKYFELFSKPVFVFAKPYPQTSKKYIQLPYYDYHPLVLEFITELYEYSWILSDFNWGEWKDTKEALDLRDNPDLLSKATPKQLSKLLTVLIRQDRFVEGSLFDSHETDLLPRILKRGKVLSEIK